MKEETAGVGRSRTCPRCRSDSLRELEVPTGPTIDLCATCRGMWFDGGELTHMLGDADVEQTLGAPGKAICPGCGVALCAARIGTDAELLRCRACRGAWVDEGHFPRLRSAWVAARRRQVSPLPATATPSSDPRSPEGGSLDDLLGAVESTWRGLVDERRDAAKETGQLLFDRIPFDHRGINLWTLPVALLLALAVNSVVVVLVLPWHIWMHELGHATVAWLASHTALPLPIGITFHGTSRHALVYAVFLALFAWMALIGFRQHRNSFIGLAVFLLAMQTVLTFFADDLAREKWITFGGCGGEIWISALCVVAFYHRAPDRIRWDFWRFPVVFLGMTTLAHAWGLWSDVAADHTRLPLGTGFKGRGDSNGDMNRLLDLHGWSVQEIVDAYRFLAFVAVAFVVAHYVWSLVRSRPGKRVSTPP